MAAGNITIPISYNLLSEFLSYDPETGVLTWIKKPARRILVGSIAGCQKCKRRGYIVFRLHGQMYYAHRVAWVLHTGEDLEPGVVIDHRNGDTTDNRITNLRTASQAQNLANSEHSLGASGVRGVVWDNSKQKWKAQISRKNRNIFLGRFDTIEEAAAARRAAEKRLFGEYSFSESRTIK